MNPWGLILTQQTFMCRCWFVSKILVLELKGHKLFLWFWLDSSWTCSFVPCRIWWATFISWSSGWESPLKRTGEVWNPLVTVSKKPRNFHFLFLGSWLQKKQLTSRSSSERDDEDSSRPDSYPVSDPEEPPAEGKGETTDAQVWNPSSAKVMVGVINQQIGDSSTFIYH